MRYNVLILSLLAMILVSCREPVQQVLGSYSYKISGTVDVDGSTMLLSDEMGALDVLRRNNSTLLLTFNQMGGGVYAAEATLEEGMLVLDGFTRTLTLDRLGRETFDVEVAGEGELLDGTIVFTLSYDGVSETGDAVLTGSDIVMIAKKNGK